MPAIIVINKDSGVHFDRGITTDVHLEGFVPFESCSVYTLDGESISAINTPSDPYAVSIISSSITIDTTFSYTFPPHSVTVFQFTRVYSKGDVNGDGKIGAEELAYIMLTLSSP